MCGTRKRFDGRHFRTQLYSCPIHDLIVSREEECATTAVQPREIVWERESTTPERRRAFMELGEGYMKCSFAGSRLSRRVPEIQLSVCSHIQNIDQTRCTEHAAHANQAFDEELQQHGVGTRKPVAARVWRRLVPSKRSKNTSPTQSI